MVLNPILRHALISSHIKIYGFAFTVVQIQLVYKILAVFLHCTFQLAIFACVYILKKLTFSNSVHGQIFAYFYWGLNNSCALPECSSNSQIMPTTLF